MRKNEWQYHQQYIVYLMGDIALALSAQIPGGSYLYLEIKRLEEDDGKNEANF